MLCYCNKCGSITDWAKPEEQSCYCCGNTPLKPIPREYIDDFRWRDRDGKQAFIEEVIKTSPNLDQYLFEHKDEIIQNKNAEMDAKIAHGKEVLEGRDKGNNFGVECPYCHATNVKKVSMAGRMFSTGLFGLASNKIGKQWHCNKCGSDF